MTTPITAKLAPHYAGLETNALLAAGVLPEGRFAGAQAGAATPVFDTNGEPLFYRVPLVSKRKPVAFVDIAAFEGFSSALLAVSEGFAWTPETLLKAATAAARKQVKGFRFDEARFVAYSYPKVAVQFLAKGREVVMVELVTGAIVPPAETGNRDTPPSNFERWSFIDRMPRDRRAKGRESLRLHLSHWDEICPPLRPPRGFKPRLIKPERFKIVFKVPRVATETRELHYSTDNADHVVCYELRGQQTNVWCVAASVQMILDFYRYNYLQTRLATELGLGTLTSPNGLPYSRDDDVVTVLEALTSNALDATKDSTPTWAQFRSEIQANRPMISFIPGHSRTVAGFTSTRVFLWYTYRGLLVYDPWPPTTGVITRWENFDTQSYRLTFTAQLTLV